MSGQCSVVVCLWVVRVVQWPLPVITFGFCLLCDCNDEEGQHYPYFFSDVFAVVDVVDVFDVFDV